MNILQLLSEKQTSDVVSTIDFQVTDIKIHYRNIIYLLVQKDLKKISFAIDNYINQVDTPQKEKKIALVASFFELENILTEIKQPLPISGSKKERSVEVITKTIVEVFKKESRGKSPEEMRNFKKNFIKDLDESEAGVYKKIAPSFGGMKKFDEFMELDLNSLSIYNKAKSRINNYAGKWFEEVTWNQIKNKEKEPIKYLYELMITILGEGYFSEEIKVQKALDEKSAFDIRISFQRKTIITISCKFRPSEIRTARGEGGIKIKGKKTGYKIGGQKSVHFDSKDIHRVRSSIKELGLNPDDYITEKLKKVANQDRKTKVYYTDAYMIIRDALDINKKLILDNMEDVLYLMRAGGKFMITTKTFKTGKAEAITLKAKTIKDVALKDNESIEFYRQGGGLLIKLRPAGEATVY